MKVRIGIIALNEAEYIGKNLSQHYELADEIVIVEGADKLYPPERVTLEGLSTDATYEIIEDFPDPDKKIRYVSHGWAKDKCELRNRYMEGLTEETLLAVIDADEFYRRENFGSIVALASRQSCHRAWSWPFVHFWRGPHQFITGGYYDVPHIRFWRVISGDRYIQNHNWPERRGKCLHIADGVNPLWEQNRILLHAGHLQSASVQRPCCYHFGFCKAPANVGDKNAYYVARGEATTRPETTASRAAWFGDDSKLPPNLRLWKYGGPLPEVFS